MTYSTALTTALHAQATKHLLRKKRQEDLCFALWNPSTGNERQSALLQELILPQKGDRSLHGNASFHPQYFERALDRAIKANMGIAFIHSHIGPGWQDMSRDDVIAEQRMAAPVMAATGLPLVGLTLGTDGAWSARFWEKIAPRIYERRWCETVRVVGERLLMTYADHLIPSPEIGEELTRTISAWGEKEQSHLARLRICIVGAGSVGNIIGESLARMGIMHVTLLDFDTVEKLNLDRLLYATEEDARKCRSKVTVLAEGMSKSATAKSFRVDALEQSVCEDLGFRLALDCDVIFSCVDRPWARQVLNFIAYSHLIPVVDGGVSIEAKANDTGLRSAEWRGHVAAPARRCLECLGQFDPAFVSVEREGQLDDPHYIKGLPVGHPLLKRENVFPFSLGAASLQLNHFLQMIIGPAGLTDSPAQIHHFTLGELENEKETTCKDTCLYPPLIAKGDRSGFIVTGKHRRAEAERESRTALRRAVRTNIEDAQFKIKQVPFRSAFLRKFLTRLNETIPPQH
jgi:molybdopterin-synthase adenylyltransferase